MDLTFPSYDVRFISVTDGVDNINGINEMSGMRNFFNDFFARDTSKKIRAVQCAKGAPSQTTLENPVSYCYLLLTLAKRLKVT